MTDLGEAQARYTFSCPDVSDSFVVTGFEATEELGRPYHVSVRLYAEHEGTDTSALLGRDATFSIARGDQHLRDFHGVIARVTVRDDQTTTQTSTVEIVPALRALEHTTATRIFQDQSALAIAQTVLREGLGPYGRELDASALDPARYLARDYCVQYRETNLDFVHRLLEEEGIGYFFAGDGPEKLILFDDNRQAPKAPTMDGASVRYAVDFREWTGAEPVVRLVSTTQLGSTGLTVRDHDWTRRAPRIEGTAPIEGAGRDRAVHGVYEHGLRRHLTLREDAQLLASMLRLFETALMPDGLPLGLAHQVLGLDGATFDAFTRSDLAHQLEIRRQLLGRDASAQRGIGLVTSFAPGRTFELLGHPTLGADGEYLITKVVHSSLYADAVDELEEDRIDAAGLNYHNRFECIPARTPWRPARRTPKPRIHGVQTARVTGPVGLNIYTDAYGRIRAQFPWDRAAEDLGGNYTCWLRVSQVWAGAGSPGFVFLPRIGMEVIVSFVDGDPDRPLVTGCVYNGENPTPGLLPIQATKSIIRTRTVPHGPGHNELSFEDAMGMERVHLRAQRDLDELVLNDHVTEVTHHQVNTVGGDQYETVRGLQQVTANGGRTVKVIGPHVESSGTGHKHLINGSEQLVVANHYDLAVEGGTFSVVVEEGEAVIQSKGPLELEQDEKRFLRMASDGDDAGILLESEGAKIFIKKDEILLQIGDSKISMTNERIQINQKTLPPIAGSGDSSA